MRSSAVFGWWSRPPDVTDADWHPISLVIALLVEVPSQRLRPYLRHGASAIAIRNGQWLFFMPSHIPDWFPVRFRSGPIAGSTLRHGFVWECGRPVAPDSRPPRPIAWPRP